jgi:hypothetical protein
MVMKKMSTYIAALTLWALVLIGCSNPFIEKRPQDNGAIAGSDMPEKFGTIQVSFSRGAAQTIMPQANLALEGPQVIQVLLPRGASSNWQIPAYYYCGPDNRGERCCLDPAASWTAGDISHLLFITNATVQAIIRRIHFKNGLAICQDAAILNSGELTLNPAYSAATESRLRITAAAALCATATP